MEAPSLAPPAQRYGNDQRDRGRIQPGKVEAEGTWLDANFGSGEDCTQRNEHLNVILGYHPLAR